MSFKGPSISEIVDRLHRTLVVCRQAIGDVASPAEEGIPANRAEMHVPTSKPGVPEQAPAPTEPAATAAGTSLRTAPQSDPGQVAPVDSATPVYADDGGEYVNAGPALTTGLVCPICMRPAAHLDASFRSKSMCRDCARMLAAEFEE